MGDEVASPERVAIRTPSAPPPAGTYSQAIRALGLLFVSGQTPRHSSGERASHQPFETQVRLTLQNLEAVARAGGTTLGQAVHVTVFLKDPSMAPAFDDIYREYVSSDPPARTLVQSDLAIGELEVNAILVVPCNVA